MLPDRVAGARWWSAGAACLPPPTAPFKPPNHLAGGSRPHSASFRGTTVPFAARTGAAASRTRPAGPRTMPAPSRPWAAPACLIAAAAAFPSVFAASQAAGGCACDPEIVEQLLAALRRASTQYGALAHRYFQLKARDASRDAILAVPLEVWFAAGLLAAWVCARLGAARALARISSDAQQLTSALSQRTAQWKVAVAEATDLAALLQRQRSAAPSPVGMLAASGDAAQEPAAADAAADANKTAERDSGACKVRTWRRAPGGGLGLWRLACAGRASRQRALRDAAHHILPLSHTTACLPAHDR
jgi:hypothetical protein